MSRGICIMTILKNYHAPTPRKWRALGDAFLIMGTTLTATFAGMEVDKGWIIASALFTAFGKIISNFFTEDPLPKQDQLDQVSQP